MTKTKKHRKESTDSEESTDSSSSSSSSSSNSTSADSSSSSEGEDKKKRKLKKMKNIKSKRRRKTTPSSSSSSSSSDTEGESSRSSSDKDNPHGKEKGKLSKDNKESSLHRRTHSNLDEKRLEQRPARNDTDDPRREVSSSHNRSKWDSPGNECEDHRRERQRGYYERNYYGNGKNNDDRRNRRYADSRNNRYPNWRNDHREWQDRPREKWRNRDNDYGNRDRDQRNFRFRDNNYNDRRNNNNRGWRNDRENRRSRSPRRPRNFPRRRSDGDRRSYEWGKREEDDRPEDASEEKEKPNFGLSGKLTEDTNKVNGIVIKYAEPLESRKPKRRWRLYPFKGEKALPTLYIHRQSCYLIGRDRKICDLPVDHPSCSKQHAAFQYRLVPFDREDGTVGKRVRPYIIDLESANGTFINNKKIDSKKYIELLEKDVIKFGFSSREYVLLHENSKEDQLDDDIVEDAVQVKEEPTD